jgi:hypothetical protein
MARLSLAAPGGSRRIGSVLAQRFPDGLAQPDPRPSPAQPAAQDVLHVLRRVPFEDGESDRFFTRLIRGVEAPCRPGLGPTRARYRRKLLSAQIANHGGVGPGAKAQQIGLGDGTGGQVGEHPIHGRLRADHVDGRGRGAGRLPQGPPEEVRQVWWRRTAEAEGSTTS